MDLAMSARYHDTQHFDAFNFTTQTWVLNAFRAQLKRSDTFVTIWNRPTRKRSLQCAPGSDPTSSVVRVRSTGEIFLVGSFQGDSKQDHAYRHVYALHEAVGVAVINRKTPAVGYGDIKEWAVNSVVQMTFADVELRSVNENMDASLEHFGHFFMFLPGNCPARKHDVIELNNKSYYVIETYIDSGLLSARVTTRPDERINLLYVSEPTNTYNPATQTVTEGGTQYKVTAKVEPVGEASIPNNSVTRNEIKIMVQKDFISFIPKLGDKVQWNSVWYTVKGTDESLAFEEWHLACHR